MKKGEILFIAIIVFGLIASITKSPLFLGIFLATVAATWMVAIDEK